MTRVFFDSPTSFSPRRRIPPGRLAVAILRLAPVTLLVMLTFLGLVQSARAAAPTYLLVEGFEGTGFENSGWRTNSASVPDADYSVDPLVGQQSLRCTGVSFVQRDFAPPSTNFSCYFRVKWFQWAPDRFVADWLSVDSTSRARVTTGFGNRLDLVYGSTAVTAPNVIETNVTYHLWIDWVKGTGADGIMRLYISTDTTKPASPQASISNGTGTADLALFDLGPFGSGVDAIYDKVLIDDELIGSDPGPNSAPVISSIPNQTTPESTPTAAIPFTVGDAETNAADLTVTGASSNTTLVPNANIVFGGSGTNRTVTIAPAAGLVGVTTITVTVSDGENSVPTSFTLTVGTALTRPTISGIGNQTTPSSTPTAAIAFTIGDAETAAGSLLVAGSSSDTTLVPNANLIFGGSDSNRTITATPAAGLSGVSVITVSVADGYWTNSTNFTLTVGTAITPPTISAIANQTTTVSTPTAAIPFTVGDAETAAGDLAVSGLSSNPTLVPVANLAFGGSGTDRTIVVTPETGLSGVATITVRVSDGYWTNATNFTVTVGTPNAPPTISAISNQTTPQDSPVGPVAFTVGDVETAPGSLTLAGASSNPTLLPVANIVFGGSGANRDLTLSPAVGQVGSSTVTVTVSDGDLTASSSFVLTVTSTNEPPSAGEFFLRERFEGAGYENAGWTAFGAPNPDFTSIVIQGEHSLHTAGNEFIHRSFNVTTNFSFYFRAQWNPWIDYDALVYWWDTNTSTAAGIYCDNNLLQIGHGTSTVVGTTPIDDGVTYHVWVDWTRGTGANGTMALYVSTNGSKPALPEAQLANGTGDFVDRLFVGSSLAGADLTVDCILASGSAIGSNPDGNYPPTISSIASQSTLEDTASGSIAFTVGDFETAATSLLVSAFAANTNLIPAGGYTFGGSDSNRTVVITPAPNQYGTTTVSVVVSDGGLTATNSFSLAVVSVDDAPVVAFSIGSRNYTEGDGAVLVDAAAVVTDGDTGNFGAGSLTVDFSANGQPEDRLGIRNEGVDPGQIGVSGVGVTYGGLGIGTFSGGTSGSSPLVIAFNTTTTPAMAQALLQNITYSNASTTPSIVTRTVRAVVDDGDGGISEEATLVLNVAGVPEDPVITWPVPAPIGYGTGLSVVQLNATANVPGVFAYSPDIGAVLNAGSQTLSVTFTPADTVNYNVATVTRSLTVTPATLTVTADNKTKTYGSANPALTATLAGFVNGDTEASLDTPVTLSTTADGTSPVGNYDIVPAGATDANYTVAFVNGTLAVNAAGPLTLTILSADAAGNATMRVTSDPGQRITIQASTDLVAWTDIVILLNPTGTIEHTDPAVPNRPNRFYRAKLSPE